MSSTNVGLLHTDHTANSTTSFLTQLSDPIVPSDEEIKHQRNTIRTNKREKRSSWFKRINYSLALTSKDMLKGIRRWDRKHLNKYSSTYVKSGKKSLSGGDYPVTNEKHTTGLLPPTRNLVTTVFVNKYCNIPGKNTKAQCGNKL